MFDSAIGSVVWWQILCVTHTDKIEVGARGSIALPHLTFLGKGDTWQERHKVDDQKPENVGTMMEHETNWWVSICFSFFYTSTKIK